MALAQYRNQANDVNITKKIPAPRKVEKMEAWFKEARKMIPQIPNPKETDWIISHETATIKYVRFDMVNTVGEKCQVVIDRTQPFIGG